MSKAKAAYIEIVERGYSMTEDDLGVIKPNEVRINGTPLLVPAGESVTVHQVDLKDRDVVKVTLTLFARRVVIGAEPTAEQGDIQSFDNGGVLRPGIEMYENQTGRPIKVRTKQQIEEKDDGDQAAG